MVVSFRNLAVLSTLLCGAASPIWSQPSVDEEVISFKMLSLAGTHQFFYENDEEETLVFANESNLSMLQQIAPQRRLELYNYVRSEEEGQPLIKETQAMVEFPANEGHFLVIVSPVTGVQDYAYRARALDHSLEVHPVETVRIFNFAARQMAVNIANENFVLNPGQSRVVPYSGDRRLWMQVAVREEGEWLRVFGAPSAVAPDTRMTFALFDITPTEADPNPTGARVRKLLERVAITEEGVQYVP